jgi:hypothetical protein
MTKDIGRRVERYERALHALLPHRDGALTEADHRLAAQAAEMVTNYERSQLAPRVGRPPGSTLAKPRRKYKPRKPRPPATTSPEEAAPAPARKPKRKARPKRVKPAKTTAPA